MVIDNISQQVDEIEALKSIYEDAWIAEDGGSFTMNISRSVKLFITLNEEYPSKRPPKFDVIAPELSPEDRRKLYKEYRIIYE